MFCCKQSLAKDTVCVCVRKIKGKFSNKGVMHGEGSRHLALNRRKETNWRKRTRMRRGGGRLDHSTAPVGVKV